MGSAQNYETISRRPPDIEDYIDMLRRYRSWIVGPMFAGLVIAVVAAFLAPDSYVSTAILTIKPQQVSERLIPSVMDASQMAERLAQMQTDILSRTTLSEIIQKPSLNLYPKERLKKPLVDVIENMKQKDLKIAPYNSPSPDRRLASAFAIQFKYHDRHVAAAVVQEVVNRFVEQSATTVHNQNNLTVSILKDEAKAAKEKRDKAEAALTQFQMQNQGRLPSQAGANSQAFMQIQMQVMNIGQQVARDQQDKLMLETQLQNLRNAQNAASANLEQTVAGAPLTVRNEKLVNLGKEITNLKSALASLKRVYGPNYPEIANTQAQIDSLEQDQAEIEKQEAVQQAGSVAPSRKVINPTAQKALQDYQAQQNTVQTQLAAKNVEIEELTKQREGLEKQMSVYQKRMEEAPLSEQKYVSLLNDLNLAKANYDDMIKRQQASDTAQNVEDHKAGEQLEMLDPPNVPEKPIEPDRWIWAGTGTFLGLVCGLVLAAAKEVKNTSLKNLKDVRAYTNLPVLSSVPLLENNLLVRRKRRLVWLAWATAVISGVVLMSGSVYYYMSNV
ncbi:MAG TPA: Wzz/FepE/Etk N-terminal domain-containing protein [Bryobacteraceae bacterium]